ncbi:hypothetical protein KMP13_03670 [Epibacterium ulvae]|uniref:Flp family type IVb pilin n=1 Tax=Epibacterium ulvae TaxID=1156985 RepID=UPI001BFCA584|nr:hypothetical protein [Epibacterium ulvae]MBT8153001.1 hypothetical protein [Epibacterium ulvae]
MKHLFRRFRDSEHGAVTVDWVVLTAVIMAAVVLLTVPLRDAMNGVLTSVSGYMDATGTAVVSRGSALD